MVTQQPIQEPITIGMVIFPNLTQLDFTGPYEVFGRIPNARICVLARTLDAVRSEFGLKLIPDTTFESSPQLDVLFVPGGAGVNPLMEDEPFLAFLRQQAERAKYVTSVCTGALLLGAAGLLTGYQATTHWLSMELLPLLGAEPVRKRIVIDRNRITGGGVTSGIDFALVVVAQLYGDAVAQSIQLSMEYDPQPPYQSGNPREAPPAIVEAVRKRSAPRQAERLEIAKRIATQIKS